MSDLKTVLVTGAAGGVGRALCRGLRAAGFDVRGLVRPEDDTTGLALSRDCLHRGYVQDSAAVARAMHGADAVLHCAALLPNQLELGRAAFEEVNVGGTRVVFEQAIVAGLKKAAFFSTISVVDHVGRHVTPDTLRDYVPGPHDAYLASKIAAEKLVHELQPRFGGQVGVFRPAFVYGPGNFAVWRDALELVKQGKMKLLGDGSAPLPLIFAGDIARFAAQWLRAPVSPGLTIHVLASRERTTMRNVFDLIADHLRVKRPKAVPTWPLRLAASVTALLPAWMRAGRLKLLTPARVRQYSHGYDLSGVLADPILDHLPMTGYRDGLPRMLDDFLRWEGKARAA
jgi:nucleoside-diphosphate-sugar epimerase